VLADPDSRQIYIEYGSEQFHSQWQFAQAQRQGKVKTTGDQDFYASSEDIWKPTWETWSDMLDGQRAVVVEFYAPWCSHCQQMVPAFKRTALMLEGESVRFAAVNCESARQKRLCTYFGVQQYPTIRLFMAGEQEEFSGSHDMLYSWIQMFLTNSLVSLDPSNFDELVLGSREPWIVDFGAGQWCRPCTVAKSRLRRLANEVAGRLRVGIIDCDAFGDFCASKSVSYYPQLRAFGPGLTPEATAGQELVYANEQQFPVVTTLDVIQSLLQAITTPTLKTADAESEAAGARDEL
jgi:thioredoxin-like negative regulator of GroEL